MKTIICILLCLTYSFVLVAQPVEVSKNNRFLQTPDGKPFFWLGDTAWELFHRLNREEAKKYLKNRSQKGFNVIQAVVLSELEPFTRANAYNDFPLLEGDISRPDTTSGQNPEDSIKYDYWDHVEWIIKKAAEYDIFIGLLPCWGEYVTPRFRERTIQTPRQGYDYGWFIGKRYKHLNDYIIWILGGDRLPDERENGIEIWRAMAEGITDAVNGEKNFNQLADYRKTFMTYHCYRSSSTWFHQDAWIDMHTWGSYHEKRDNERAYFEAYKDWNLPSHKPTLNSEPAYELLPINYHWKDASLGYFDDFDVRQIAFWSVFSGTCGHTYGCHPVWQMYKKENPNPPLTNTVHKEWFEALDESGAFHMTHLKNLLLSHPFFSRIPNQSLLVENPYDPTGYLTACSGDGYFFVYIPTGKTVQIETGLLKVATIKVWWFNPRTGEVISEGKKVNQDIIEFDPPGKRKRGNDWVLVIDDGEKEFPEPGNYLGEKP